jgi:2-polyprenyl-3-methyl-5-hydroxy-6-metoxy-1,4-benzoquinol methylase
MDQPGLDVCRHHDALRGLARINFWSGSARLLWPALRALARETAPEPVRVLDVATGGGDVPIRLWHKARRSGVALAITGCDINPQAVAYAQAQAARAGAAVRFFVWDARAPSPPPSPEGGRAYHAVTCSLFLHHLAADEAVSLLRRMGALAGRMVLVNDLVRSRAGFVLAYVGTRLLSASPVVHTDGPRSVEAAFTRTEALDLARRAGLAGAVVERRWPCRFLLTWKRPQGPNGTTAPTHA